MHISIVFLTEFRSAFPTVRITTRNPKSPKARELAKLGADMRSLSEPPEDVVSGADVVVDALPPQVAGDYRERVLKALVRENVKLFFLSEYGMYVLFCFHSQPVCAVHLPNARQRLPRCRLQGI